MAAYYIFQIEITDAQAFARYAEQVPATIAEFGGEYVVRGGDYQVVEGDWPDRRMVILKFPSRERARAWYASESYRGPKALRQAAARADAILVEGV